MTSLSVVIPAYNEEQRLPGTVERILGYLSDRKFDFAELLIVDDGSCDRTAAVAGQYASANPAVRLLRNPGNCGKGYAVRSGMLNARGQWVLFSDADLSTPIEEVEKLAAAVRNSDAAIAIGSRALDRSLIAVRQRWGREAMGRIFNLAVRAITGLPFRDTQCGFKLYRTDAARAVFSRQQLDGFGFDVEDLVIARLLRLPVAEIPVRWSNVAGTKVTGASGLRSFFDLLRIRANQMSGRYRLTSTETSSEKPRAQR